jgi:uncharacterized protein (UPF0335 family)
MRLLTEAYMPPFHDKPDIHELAKPHAIELAEAGQLLHAIQFVPRAHKAAILEAEYKYRSKASISDRIGLIGLVFKHFPEDAEKMNTIKALVLACTHTNHDLSHAYYIKPFDQQFFESGLDIHYFRLLKINEWKQKAEAAPYNPAAIETYLRRVEVFHHEDTKIMSEASKIYASALVQGFETHALSTWFKEKLQTNN